jgi:replication-associated recombination protein RarA
LEFLGSPEGDLALAEAVVYLCLAPKSNSVYTAYGAVQAEIEHTRQEPVPLHLRNAPTRLMKELDYGKGYRYAHDEEGRVADMDCLPDSLRGHSITSPRRKAARSCWRSGWKRFGGSGKQDHASCQSSPHRRAEPQCRRAGAADPANR